MVKSLLFPTFSWVKIGTVGKYVTGKLPYAPYNSHVDPVTTTTTLLRGSHFLLHFSKIALRGSSGESFT